MIDLELYKYRKIDIEETILEDKKIIISKYQKELKINDTKTPLCNENNKMFINISKTIIKSPLFNDISFEISLSAEFINEDWFNLSVYSISKLDKIKLEKLEKLLLKHWKIFNNEYNH